MRTKSKARSQARKEAKTKNEIIIIFRGNSIFSENVFRVFQAPIRRPRFVQSPRSAFPFLVLTVTAAPAGVFCLPDPGYLRGRRGGTVLVRLTGSEGKKRNDGSSAHQPITTSHPNHFRPLVDFAGNAEEREEGAAPSDFYLALRLFSHFPIRAPLSQPSDPPPHNSRSRCPGQLSGLE